MKTYENVEILIKSQNKIKSLFNFRKGQKKSLDQLSWSQFYDDHSTARRTYDLFGISFDPTIFKANREVKTIYFS